MRIHLKIDSSREDIPFIHQHLLTGVIHKWIGSKNDQHDGISLYSFSHLEGGRSANGGLKFTDGSAFFISTWEKTLVRDILEGIQKNPNMFNGLKVREVIIQPTDDFSSRSRFLCASPVFIKRNIDQKTKFYFHSDPESTELMTETIHHKMKKAGLPIDETLKIAFDKTYAKAKTKQIIYKNMKNVASVCPLIIEGKPESKEFVWNVGVGNSTGIGFGAIK